MRTLTTREDPAGQEESKSPIVNGAAGEGSEFACSQTPSSVLKSSRRRPVRILQIVGAMRRGGVETWLMHVLRGVDRERFSIDFVVHTNDRCAFDEEIESLGSSIYRCPLRQRPDLYARALWRVLREHGPYDVIHSHVHHFSGFTLAIARAAGVPVRFAHSHNDTHAMELHARPLRKLYLGVSAWLIQKHANRGIAASAEAARSLFGLGWDADRRWSILHCGIGLEAFADVPFDPALRAQLGVPPDTLVIGHVGRFDPQKNHKFFIEIAGEVARRRSDARFLFIGDGPLRHEIESLAAANALTQKCIFAGVRGDVPGLMQHVIDVLLFPSHFEGLPLTLLEAQAAALPAVISDVISPEADVVPGLITRLPLSARPTYWADAVLRAASKGRPDRYDCLSRLEQSSFNSAVSRANLLSQYTESICLNDCET